MRLSRLRVGIKAEQLLMFGLNSTKDSIPEAPDENLYFPQYVPTRAKCPTPSFTVTWVRKVTTLREVPSRIRADPSPLTTGLLWDPREHDLIDPYRVAAGLFGSDAIPDHHSPERLAACSARGRKCSLRWTPPDWFRAVRVKIGFTWSAAMGSLREGCAPHIVRSLIP